jgi:malonyl-CoA O-methyltransferase
MNLNQRESRSAQFEKHQVAQSFSKAAKQYDQYAVTQREIGDRLFERLELMAIAPKRVLDVGCGTGHYTRQLKRKYSSAKVMGLDLARGMIEQAKANNDWLTQWGLKQGCEYICGDMDHLPFEDNSLDLIFSNLALQWSLNPAETFAEWSRVLKPGGLLIFSTLGPDTLKELRSAWQQVDDRVHVNPFIDMHDLGDDLLRAGIQNPVMDMEKIVFHYQTLKGLFHDLKGIGAHNMNAGRPRGLMSKGTWQAMVQAYQHFCVDQQYPVTYEAIYGHGWGSEFNRQRQAINDSIYPISL